jgi:hypothetical protein
MNTFAILAVLIAAVILTSLRSRPHRVNRAKCLRVRF